MHKVKSIIITLLLCSVSCSVTKPYIPSYQEVASYAKNQYQSIRNVWDKKYSLLLAPSPWIGNCICRYINGNATLRVLINDEGMGPIVDQIVQATHQQSTIDIFEQHPLIREELQARIAQFLPRTIQLHATKLERSALQGITKNSYDIVISRLSINNLSFESLEHLLTRVAKLTRYGGMFVYFDFYGRISFDLLIKIIKQFILESVNTYVRKVSETRLRCAVQEIKSLMAKQRLLHNWQDEHFNVIDKKVVWLNAFPIAIVCLQKQ